MAKNKAHKNVSLLQVHKHRYQDQIYPGAGFCAIGLVEALCHCFGGGPCAIVLVEAHHITMAHRYRLQTYS